MGAYRAVAAPLIGHSTPPAPPASPAPGLAERPGASATMAGGGDAAGSVPAVEKMEEEERAGATALFEEAAMAERAQAVPAPAPAPAPPWSRGALPARPGSVVRRQADEAGEEALPKSMLAA